MLRRGLTVLIATILTVGSARADDETPDPGTVPTEGRVDLETRDLASLNITQRDTWYVRGFNKLLARKDPAEESAEGKATQHAEAPFLPYAGLTIHRIRVLHREAFGTVAADTAVTLMEEPTDSLVTRTSPVERLLNSLATGTHEFVIRQFLLFAEGDPLDPFDLADSERLLRDQQYIKDARIGVIPLDDRPGEVDVLVLVRDRWPWGAKANVKDQDNYDLEFFHRNVGGLGLNLEVQSLYSRGRSPEVGWRTKASTTNLGGSFIDLAAEFRRTWENEQTTVDFTRGFAWPNIRYVGGFGVRSFIDKNHPELPAGATVHSLTQDSWFGRAFSVGGATDIHHRRRRLVPALRVLNTHYHDPPRQYVPYDYWRDRTMYLGQLSLVELDYLTTSLVYGYGETEDIPTGFWLAATGGFESGELGDRAYHGFSVAWPRFLRRHRYFALDASLGGYRRRGRFEDGVLDLGMSTFSPLRRHDYGHWRHFLYLRYTLGINQHAPDGLRLDQAGLRDLDDATKAGNQRLVAAGESVLFSPYSFLGFRIAAFGYAGGGIICQQREPVFQQRVRVNVGLGLRLNNPNLVLPTVSCRVGLLNSSGDWEPVVTVSMGDLDLLRRLLPSVKPGTLAYR